MDTVTKHPYYRVHNVFFKRRGKSPAHFFTFNKEAALPPTPKGAGFRAVDRMNTLTITQEPYTPELASSIDEGFSQHAFEMTGFKESILRAAFIARDKGAFVGCVCANVLWGTVHIQFMFIEATYRRQGIGTRLMKKAIEFGEANGCSAAFVDTFSFQAIGFYQKLGFEHEFTRSGFAHGATRHYLKKALGTESPLGRSPSFRR